MEADRAKATHLVVFQHGLLGSDQDFANLKELFDRHLGQDLVYAHIATCNATSFGNVFQTCDGIDCGAERLATEIIRVAATLPRVTRFSIVGHSMGGLYARYCVGVLYSRGFFAKIEPMNFITMATPHLGSRRPQRGSINLLFNSLMPRLFDRTGVQFALQDEASASTLALAKPVEDKYPHRPSRAACQELDGVVPTCLRRSSPGDALRDSDFTPTFCELRNRVLSFYETAEQAKRLATIELQQAEVILVLPDKPNPSSHWDIIVSLPIVADCSAIHVACTLRLHVNELTMQWKWVTALSNATFGLRCVTRSSLSTQGLSSSTKPPLIACLARGQFIQALQLFRVRTLYSTVYNDHQVPYSCGAIRAFNPYRHESDPAALCTSPYYDHIIERSVWQAPLLRDTLPLDAKVNATRKSTAKFLQSRERDADGATSSVMETSAVSASSPTPSFASIFWGSGDIPVVRSAPFSESHLLLDRVDDAFSNDEARDTLRGLLVSMQSVGWRRLDANLDSVLAHEMIIAKRADVANAPLEWGLDILHHLLDSFLLA